jgi:hypothetical protein
VKVLARVVDYGGLFHDDVKPGFKPGDHRAFRAQGWVESGYEKLNQIRPIAKKHGLTLLQLACWWDLAHEPVASVVPTLIQEVHDDAKPIAEKIRELADLPEKSPLSHDETQRRQRPPCRPGSARRRMAHQRSFASRRRTLGTWEQLVEPTFELVF